MRRALESAIDDYFANAGGQPQNIKTQVIVGTFEDTANDILGSITTGYVLAPALAFIDPFGFKGISMDTICRQTAFPKCEVLFSFMYNSLKRWVTHPQEAVHVSLRDLFNTEAYEDAGGLTGQARREFLHDLYKRQLR